MHQIHPEIKKFWEEAGYFVEGPDDRVSVKYFAWTMIKKSNGDVSILAITDRYDDSGKSYCCPTIADSLSEEEMLRVIKLKVFM